MQQFYQIFQILDKWKWSYLGAGLFLTIASLIRMLEPKIIQLAVDTVVHFFEPSTTSNNDDFIIRFFHLILPSVDSSTISWHLFYIGLLLLVIVSIKAIVWFGADIMVASRTEKAIKAFRDRLFEHIQKLSLSQMNQIPTGEMIQRCTGDIGTIQKFIGTQISELIRLTAIAFGSFGMMWIAHPHYALISVSLFIPIILTSYVFFRKEQSVWEAHETEQDKLTAIIQENLAGIRVVQSFAEEQSELNRFAIQNKAKRDIGVRHIDLHMVFWPFSDWLVNIQIAMSLCAGAYYALLGEITIGVYASFFAYAIMVTWPMRNLGRIVSQLGMAGVAMNRIMLILKAEKEDYSTNNSHITTELKGDIEFQGVWFTYPNDKDTTQQKWALEDVSFKINQGEQLAIMGSTGAGKSTIIALLLRFYEPTKGLILLDGEPLSSYDKTTLRKKIGVVLQKPFLFSTTIRQNIAYARYDAEGNLQLARQEEHQEEAFDKATADACVADFIDKMADGYNTIIGERGVTLSGGQKQRVALARTLLSKPSVLVLDDATSAVDTETEYHIQQALQERMKDKTSIVLAHRLTSVQHADKILVLENGKVLEFGTQEELLLNNLFYKQVYDIQSSIEESI